MDITVLRYVERTQNLFILKVILNEEGITRATEIATTRVERTIKSFHGVVIKATIKYRTVINNIVVDKYIINKTMEISNTMVVNILPSRMI